MTPESDDLLPTNRPGTGLSIADPPRRFALIEHADVEPGVRPGPSQVFCWGVAVTGTAVTLHRDGTTTRLSSAERAVCIFGHTRILDLVWLDNADDAELTRQVLDAIAAGMDTPVPSFEDLIAEINRLAEGEAD